MTKRFKYEQRIVRDLSLTIDRDLKAMVRNVSAEAENKIVEKVQSFISNERLLLE